ncbi:MAG: ChaN family lipoprotein [Schleiferiaceae bacterium]|nr:ChaN family lipoprotein [Schleiferiaceae bacterium]
MKKQLTIVFALAIFTLSAQDKPAYQLFNAKGKKVSFAKMTKAAGKVDVVLFGEYHNNPICHWLQYELSLALLAQQPLTLGAEMFEADQQRLLSAYINKNIDKAEFDTTARLWINYKTDYEKLVLLARDSGLTFIATNIPRKYASLLYRHGDVALDTLSEGEKAFMAPLPFPYDPDLPGYKAMLEMMGGHGSENLPRAQAIKDATMAHFILQNLEDNAVFLHFNGTYHSDNFEGIGWYLNYYNENVSLLTIATVSQADVKKLAKENKGRADFILVVDENMTTTY